MLAKPYTRKFTLTIFSVFALLIHGGFSSRANFQEIFKDRPLIYSKSKHGNNIFKIDLDSLVEEKFFQSIHYSSHFRGMTLKNNSHLIFAECTSLNLDCQLNVFNFKGNNWEVWGKGLLPTYLTNRDLIAYYQNNPENESVDFVISKFSKPTEILFKANAKIPKDDPFYVNLDPKALELEDSKILFLGEDGELKIYNLESKVIFGTMINQCSPKFWRKKEQKLYCRKWKNGSILEIDFKNSRPEKVLNIPSIKGVIKRIIYDDDLDILIFSTINTNFLLNELEKYRIYSYSFINKETKYIKDGPLGDGLLLPTKN